MSSLRTVESLLQAEIYKKEREAAILLQRKEDSGVGVVPSSEEDAIFAAHVEHVEEEERRKTEQELKDAEYARRLAEDEEHRGDGARSGGGGFFSSVVNAVVAPICEKVAAITSVVETVTGVLRHDDTPVLRPTAPSSRRTTTEEDSKVAESDEDRIVRESYLGSYAADTSVPEGWSVCGKPCLPQGANECGVNAAQNAWSFLTAGDCTSDVAKRQKEEVLSNVREWLGYSEGQVMRRLTREQVENVFALFAADFPGCVFDNLFLLDGCSNILPASTVVRFMNMLLDCPDSRALIPGLVAKHKESSDSALRDIPRADCVVSKVPLVTLQDLDNIIHPNVPAYLSSLRISRERGVVVLLTLVEHCNHWVVAVVDTIKKEILVYDSINPAGRDVRLSPEVACFVHDLEVVGNNAGVIEHFAREYAGAYIS